MEENKGKNPIMLGWSEGTISQEGYEQLSELERKFLGETVDRIYTSDLMRHKATAEAIAKGCGARIHYDERLKEIHLGTYTGKHKSKCIDYLTSEGIENFDKIARKKFPKGESFYDLYQRSNEALEEIESLTGKNIVVISNGPMQMRFGRLNGVSIVESLLGIHIKQAEIYEKHNGVYQLAT